MVIKIRSIPFIFARVRFASDARAVIALERYTIEEVAVTSGFSTAACKDLLSAQHKNPHMQTFLAICNALDLNPINYFDLAE